MPVVRRRRLVGAADVSRAARAARRRSRSVAATVVVYLERGLDMPAVQAVIETMPLARRLRHHHHRRAEHCARPQPRPATIRRPSDGVATAALCATVPHHRTSDRAWTASSACTPTRSSSTDRWLVSAGIPTRVACERVWPIFRRNVALTVGGDAADAVGRVHRRASLCACVRLAPWRGPSGWPPAICTPLPPIQHAVARAGAAADIVHRNGAASCARHEKRCRPRSRKSAGSARSSSCCSDR